MINTRFGTVAGLVRTNGEISGVVFEGNHITGLTVDEMKQIETIWEYENWKDEGSPTVWVRAVGSPGSLSVSITPLATG